MRNNKQFLYFITSGGLAAGLNIFSRIIFSNFFSYEIAIILAFLVGLSSGFILMRYFVFDGIKENVGGQAIRYILVNILAIAQTFIVSIFLKDLITKFYPTFALAELIAHMAGVLVPVITSFFAHKWYTFRKKVN